jgi:tripartite-type tricarboxylate transporter receptor subunit TctC
MKRRGFLKWALAIGAASSVARPMLARPSGRVLKIVFPFGAGGAGDSLCRVLAEHVSTVLDRAVIIENRTGADGRIGINAVKAAPADGNTFLVTTGPTMWLMPMVHSAPGYDPFNDFEPVSRLALFEFCVAAANITGIKTPTELAAWIKGNPDKATYAIPGAGTLPHFIGVSLGKAIGVDMKRLPYRGGAPAISDLVAGHIPLSVGTLADALQQHRAGNLHMIATSGEKRSPFVPEVPTLKECGFDIIADAWYGLWAPKGTSDVVTAKLNDAVVAALAKPEVKQRLEGFGLVAAGTSAVTLTELMKANVARWKDVIEQSGYKMEN